MTYEQRLIQDTAYKVLELMADFKFRGFDYVDIEELETLIANESPEVFEKYQADHPKEPKDGEAWSGGFAENH